MHTHFLVNKETQYRNRFLQDFNKNRINCKSNSGHYTAHTHIIPVHIQLVFCLFVICCSTFSMIESKLILLVY